MNLDEQDFIETKNNRLKNIKNNQNNNKITKTTTNNANKETEIYTSKNRTNNHYEFDPVGNMN